MFLHDRKIGIGFAAALALAFTLGGCASPETTPELVEADSALAGQNGLMRNGLMRNGLMRNGLMRNGLMRNGLMRNGLTENGLMRNGLLTADFATWFDEDPDTSAAVMGYVVRCAAPADATYSFTSPTTGVTYSWSGSLGLAPGFSSGLEATEPEEQIISACLAAHVNKYGIHVNLSILGAGATGVAIPFDEGELATFAQPEGCFYGNLFADEGFLAGVDHPVWDPSVSSLRACALGLDPVADCPPINNAGQCSDVCTADPTGTYYVSCGQWLNGAWKTYLPVTTRILPSDVYQCGDGTCQFTEQCGTGTSADSCLADCGACP